MQLIEINRKCMKRSNNYDSLKIYDSNSKIIENLPNYIYKCRDWNDLNHKEILSKREWHFAQPKDFDDFLDCRFPVNLNLDYKVFERKFRTKAEELAVKFGLSTNSEYADLILKSYYEKRFNGKVALKELEELFYKSISDNFFIFSASKTDNGYQLWKEYGANFKGFCVEFNLEKMESEISTNIHLLGDVIYLDKEKVLIDYLIDGEFNDNREAYIKLFSTKSPKFKFENEFRMIMSPELLKNRSPNMKFENKFKVPSDAYSAIIFGEDMQEYHINEIIQVCVEQGLNVKYKRALKLDKDVKIISFKQL